MGGGTASGGRAEMREDGEVVDVYATDEEKVEALKKWWKANGRSLIIGVALGLAVVFGWRTWNEHRQQQAEQASNVYAGMMGAMSAQKNEAAIQQGEQLISHHADSSYAVYAALAIAKLRLEQGEAAAAATQLEWALQHASTDPLKQVARLRLARVLLSEGKADAALQRIQDVDQGGFGGEYQDLLGDIYAAQGKTAAARAAYAKALAQLKPGAPTRTLVKMKMNDLAATAEKGKP